MKRVTFILVFGLYFYSSNAQWSAMVSGLTLSKISGQDLPPGKFYSQEKLSPEFKVNFFGGDPLESDSQASNYPAGENPLVLRITLTGGARFDGKNVESLISGNLKPYFQWSIHKGFTELIGIQSSSIITNVNGNQYGLKCSIETPNKADSFRIAVEMRPLYIDHSPQIKAHKVPKNFEAILNKNSKGETHIASILTHETYIQARTIDKKAIAEKVETRADNPNPANSVANVHTSVFPTVFTSSFNVAVDSKIAQEITVHMSDINGRVLNKSIFNITAGHNEMILTPALITMGTYVVKIYGQGVNGTHKVIRI